MSLALGATLGLGLLLALSPLLWPARAATPSRGGSRQVVRDELRLAGLGSVPVPAILAVMVVLALVAAAVAQAVFGLLVLTGVAGALGLGAVPAAVHSRAVRRRAGNRAAWPEVVDHLVAAVRSGMSLPDAIGALGTLGPAATREPFAAFDADYRRTGAFGPALDRLKDRLADPVADRILETLRMAREVGGSEVTHVLRSLSGYLREDAALRAEVRSRQSWIRNAARLGVAAPWLLLLLLATKPETIGAYDTPVGTALLLVGLAVTVVAYRSMIALGRIPEERRWFT
ncbi:type II secretion system protein F [Agromyces sp. CFH 90414]|uniref:Type II secretion system protein F n=1 Tax=Agromyces agglutinans TaxID=2662258 RepID=A0A6I2F567_9MICO|nr:type II secretion system F family protein [Agromyces agglutinans]MRG58867.1 type II secretion system protein F [Agromyces agglutinans]